MPGFMTVAIYLCRGTFFWTKAPNNELKTNLKLTGEAFLAG
jgi:hypothetical protein